MDNAIEIDSLTKEFDGLVAVDHVSLNVAGGEIFGFLGPNGAGKTTAIKMLCTILNPTAGSARVCGYDIVQQRDKVRECIGIVFQDRAIDTFLTGKENLDFHARMYHLDRKTRQERVEQVLELMDLKGKENMKVSECSGGTQRRFEVAPMHGIERGALILVADTKDLVKLGGAVLVTQSGKHAAALNA